MHFLPPTLALLHLIIHAVHDHLFNIGPVILTDVRYVLQSSRIDWPLF